MLAKNKSDLAQLLEQNASRGILLLGAAIGAGCFAFYYHAGLTVAHYDAKAHLVVARRLFDSVEPGYAQMGANWLPLLHLIYLPFVLFDAQYRSGLLPSLISVACFALSGWLVFRITRRATGSTEAGLFAGILLLANPNLEYLQSCPLTEPVYMALELLALEGLMRWRDGEKAGLPWLAAVWAALGGLCRYEGWYFLAGILLLSAWDFRTRFLPRKLVLRAATVFAAVFALPVGAHFAWIHYRLGDNFLHRVAQGNAIPDEAYRRPFLALFYHLGELCQASALVPLLVAALGIVCFLLQREQVKRRAPLLLLWLPSLINISALYWGMIYRIRYSVLLVPAVAVFAGLASASTKWTKRSTVTASLVAMSLPWLSWYFPRDWDHHVFFPGPGAVLLPAAALVLLMLSLADRGPRWLLLALCLAGMRIPALFGEHLPILAETLEHAFIEPERHQVLDYLRRHYDGSPILIDMGKLAPLIYDSGLPVRDFIYNEGDDRRWHRALHSPEDEVGWLCAQNGDEVWQRLQVDPHLADGYSLAVKTEYFSLYRLKSRFRGGAAPAGRFQ